MTQIKNKLFIITVLTILICFNSCYSQNDKPKKPATLEMTASLGGSDSFLDTIGVIYISATLYNPTPDTIKFVSMTCSYEDLFTTNTDTFKVQSRYDCYSNYPTVVTLLPKTKTDSYIMVTRTPKGKNVDTSKFRVGMYYLEYQKGKTFDDIIKLYEHRQKTEIIWSNELDLKRFYKTNY